MNQIYLDHNSTTPIDARVAEAIHQCNLAGYANPASQHQSGRRARRVLEAAREAVGRMINANVADVHADRVIFTSGGTEANNLAILGMVDAAPGRVIVSSIEHPSVLGPAEQLGRLGYDIRYLRADKRGVVDLDHLSELLNSQTQLVSVMLANNETGVLQPVAEAARICRDRRIAFHTDAVQAVGKQKVDFQQLGVTALSLTAHKFHGPLGIGALVVRNDAKLNPIMYGGFQQESLRPGTEMVALAAGLQIAMELWEQEADSRHQHLRHLRDRLEQSLLATLPDTIVNGVDADRLPHTSNLAFPGVDRQALVMALDLANVACSTGSACASGSSEPSPVLAAMNLSREIIEASIRISLGIFNNASQIDQAIDHISRTVKDLRHPKRMGN